MSAFEVRPSAFATGLAVFEELLELVRRREPIPASEFPLVRPSLEGYQCASHVLSEDRLSSVLSDARDQAIRVAILGRATSGIRVDYRTDPSV